MGEETHNKPLWRRGWFLALVAFGVLILAAVYSAGTLLRIERYHPQFEALLEDSTGLPASIERLDLRLFPAPRLDAQNVTVGEPGFMARADRIYLPLRLRSLFDGFLEISEVRVVGVVAEGDGPPEHLVERVDGIREALERRRMTRSSPSRISVERVVVPDAQFALMTAGRVLEGRTSFTIEQPQSEQATLRIHGESSALGPAAQGVGAFTIHRHARGGMAAFEGTVRIEALDVRTLLNRFDSPELGASVTATVRSSDHAFFMATIEGDLFPMAGTHSMEAALAGPVTGTAWMTDEGLVINDVVWEGRDGRVEGDLTIYRDGQMGLIVPHGVVIASGLNLLLPLVSNDATRVNARESSQAVVQDLLIAIENDALPRLISGQGSIYGLDIVSEPNGILVENLEAAVVVQEGVFTIEAGRADGMEFSGRVRPDYAEDRYEARLTGTVHLDPERLGGMGDRAWLSRIEGRVVVEELTAILASKAPRVQSLTVVGALREGGGVIETTSYRDELHDWELSYIADLDGIRLEGGGRSDQFQEMTVEGYYAFDARAFEGRVGWDVSGLDIPIAEDSLVHAVLAPALQTYGRSEASLRWTYAINPHSHMAVDLERHGEPPFRAKAEFERTDTGWTMTSLDGTTVLPASMLEGVLTGVGLTGQVAAHVQRSRHAPDFSAEIDLTDAMVHAGEALRKDAGQKLRFDVAGSASAWPWQPTAVRIDVLDQILSGRVTDDRVWFDELDVDVTVLVPLLVDGPRASGRIRGQMATNPLELELELLDVRAALSEAVVLDSVNGGVAYRDGFWLFDDLVFRGANSDCTVNARMDDGGWRGVLTGSQLDLNALGELWDEFRALRPEEADAPPDPARRPRGRFDLQVDRALYRRGVIQDVQTRLTLDGETITLENIQARAGGGMSQARQRYSIPPLRRPGFLMSIYRCQASTPGLLMPSLSSSPGSSPVGSTPQWPCHCPLFPTKSRFKGLPAASPLGAATAPSGGWGSPLKS